MPTRTCLLALLCFLSSPPVACAQRPAGSALAGLPPPPAAPSDMLAAYLFRIETVVDQPMPCHPSEYEGSVETWIELVLMPWMANLSARSTWLREEVPHDLTGAERIVAAGAEGLLRERVAEWLEAVGQMIGLPDRWADDVIAARTAAMRRWMEITTSTDDASEARAWVAYAEARLAALRGLMPAAPVEADLDRR